MATKLKAYPEYKPSGIDWLGQIPSHWSKCRFKNFLELITTPSISEKKIGLENIECGSGKFVETDSCFEGSGIDFQKDDIVYGKLRPYLRKVWKAQFSGNAVGDFFVFRCNEYSSPDYVKYLFLSGGFSNFVNSSTFGAKMPRVSSDFILSLHYYLPPVEEQEAIAAYLDEAVGKIDALICEKRKQVEDIRAYRTSLITETVTRGLNPEVPLRPSGIDWLGQIPNHWKTIKTSYVFDNIGSGTTPTAGEDQFYEGGSINWLQTGDLNDGVINSTSKKITPIAVESRNLKFYDKGSVVIAMYGATIAKLGLLDIQTTVNQACCVLTPSSKIYSKFAFYFFHGAKKELISLASGGGQPNISQATISNFKMLVPPLDEQQAIADFLDAKTAKIDELIGELTKQIDQLAEYKQAVITEAVTGKVDLRNFKPSN